MCQFCYPSSAAPSTTVLKVLQRPYRHNHYWASGHYYGNRKRHRGADYRTGSWRSPFECPPPTAAGAAEGARLVPVLVCKPPQAVRRAIILK